MSSLYLGTIGSSKNQYEIRAFTNGKPFGFFTAEEIGDTDMFSKMLSERFKSLKLGRTIYCTAVNPNIAREIEQNPHDDREGTVHVAAIDKRSGNMSCILSVAVDTGENDGSGFIGLPLENRWQKNGYPEGSLLDEFRAKYSILNRGGKDPVKPWQMAELYRHLRVNGDPGEHISRLGIYTGLYHLIVREPRNRGKEETSIWLFDAIPKYFHLYRLAGAAVLRDQTIEDKPRHISPDIGDIEKAKNGEELFYQGELISRGVDTLKPIPGILGDTSFVRETVPFMDGVIDIQKVESAIAHDPDKLVKIKYQGISEENISILSIAQTVFAKRLFDETFSNDPIALECANKKREFIAPHWDFNGLGR